MCFNLRCKCYTSWLRHIWRVEKSVQCTSAARKKERKEMEEKQIGAAVDVVYVSWTCARRFDSNADATERSTAVDVNNSNASTILLLMRCALKIDEDVEKENGGYGYAIAVLRVQHFSQFFSKKICRSKNSATVVITTHPACACVHNRNRNPSPFSCHLSIEWECWRWSTVIGNDGWSVMTSNLQWQLFRFACFFHWNLFVYRICYKMYI